VAGLVSALAIVSLAQTGRIGLRQIVVSSETDAEALRARVLGGESFRDLASVHSIDPATRGDGGYMGTVALGELRAEFRGILEGLRSGEVSPSVRVEGRFYLFELMSEAEMRWREADDTGFEALQQGLYPDAIRAFEAAVDAAEAPGGTEEQLARSLNSLADAYRASGNPAAAVGLYRRALGILEARLGQAHPDVALSLNSLGLALLAEMRYDEAAEALGRALGIRELAFGPDQPQVATTLANLAAVGEARGDLIGAARALARALPVLERTPGEGHPVTLEVRSRLIGLGETLLPQMMDRFSRVLSLAYFREDLFESESRAFRDLVEVTPLDEASYVVMKDLLLASDLTELAGDVLGRGVERFPESRFLRYHQAEWLAETGRNREALAALLASAALPASLDLDPEANRRQEGFIQQRIGDIHADLFEFEEARQAYTRALEIDPRTPGGRVALGRMYFESNRLEEALAELERAASDRSADGPTGSLEAASEAELARIVRLVDDHALEMALAEVHLALGNLEEASSAAERAIVLDEADPQAHYLRGRALVRLGQRDEGTRELDEFARLNAAAGDEERRDREIDAIDSEAAAALLRGEIDRAIDLLEAGVGRYPELPRLHMNLGLALGRAGRHREAIDRFEAILALGIVDDYVAHQLLADAYRAIGDAEASERHEALYLEGLGAEIAPTRPE
jgi:tetratricopeptide (TPR) repeat protein